MGVDCEAAKDAIETMAHDGGLALLRLRLVHGVASVCVSIVHMMVRAETNWGRGLELIIKTTPLDSRAAKQVCETQFTIM